MSVASHGRPIRSILSDVFPLYHIRVGSVCVLCKNFQAFRAFCSPSRPDRMPERCPRAPRFLPGVPSPPLAHAKPAPSLFPSRGTAPVWRALHSGAQAAVKHQMNPRSAAYSNSTTCVQLVKNSRSAPCCLVICAAATIGSHFCTYWMAMSLLRQKSFR